MIYFKILNETFFLVPDFELGKEREYKITIGSHLRQPIYLLISD